MTQDAVLGFRPHTYWSAVVAVGGTVGQPQVLHRRRFEFAGPAERFIYHQAAEGELAAAAPRIAAARAACEAAAAGEIRQLLVCLQRQGVRVRSAAVPAATRKVPDRLEDILAAHARIHAAEGEFSRDVMAAACQAAGLAVVRVVEKELPALVGDRIGVGREAVTARLKSMGATLGPPWSEDFKLCTQAAWLQL